MSERNKDDFTSTVDGAAAYERTHADERHSDPRDDMPTRAEAERDEAGD